MSCWLLGYDRYEPLSETCCHTALCLWLSVLLLSRSAKLVNRSCSPEGAVSCTLSPARTASIVTGLTGGHPHDSALSPPPLPSTQPQLCCVVVCCGLCLLAMRSVVQCRPLGVVCSPPHTCRVAVVSFFFFLHLSVVAGWCRYCCLSWSRVTIMARRGGAYVY